MCIRDTFRVVRTTRTVDEDNPEKGQKAGDIIYDTLYKQYCICLLYTSGNKHTPSGGASGQILKWSADGTAVWGSEKVYTHPNSGVTAGTYKSVTVNDQGHVTAGSNPTTLADVYKRQGTKYHSRRRKSGWTYAPHCLVISR